jgi:hypothetical protein
MQTTRLPASVRLAAPKFHGRAAQAETALLRGNAEEEADDQPEHRRDDRFTVTLNEAGDIEHGGFSRPIAQLPR